MVDDQTAFLQSNLDEARTQALEITTEMLAKYLVGHSWNEDYPATYSAEVRAELFKIYRELHERLVEVLLERYNKA